jgi:acyl-CoA reductase-like NAD-dependent aldehyde dehydrogenase
MANDSVYGLCASVWTRDLAKGIKFADEINAGHVWVNEHMLKLLELPWGGVKESGFGKGSSIYGILEYTQLKVVHVDLSGQKEKAWHRL